MILTSMALGPIQANCYILGCERKREAAVIDPGGEAERILTELARHELTLKHIVNTHGHFDHVSANGSLKKATGASILIHAEDAPMLTQLAQAAASWGLTAEDSPPPDRYLADGDEVTFGDITLKVIHTPGHSPGGIALFTDDCVFVGDTLFAGSVGRTDLPGGNPTVLKDSIQQKLFPLGDEIKVYPGHMQTTTIGAEKRHNPFVGARGIL